MKVNWIVTTIDVYNAIYQQHTKQLSVFHTISGGGHWDPDSDRYLTEWGFNNTDVPLIKSDRRNGVWTYYIAAIESDE